MVVLNKIYTKTGDAGTTALGNGERVAKHTLRVDAYGTTDETNATVGLARMQADGDMDDALARIQNDLFDLGADLCRPDMAKDADAEYTPLRMTEGQVDRLESEIDAMNEALGPAPVLCIAWRVSAGGAIASLSDCVPACRTIDDRVSHPRRCQRACPEIPQQTVRLVLRCFAGRQ